MAIAKPLLQNGMRILYQVKVITKAPTCVLCFSCVLFLLMSSHLNLKDMRHLGRVHGFYPPGLSNRGDELAEEEADDLHQYYGVFGQRRHANQWEDAPPEDEDIEDIEEDEEDEDIDNDDEDVDNEGDDEDEDVDEVDDNEDKDEGVDDDEEYVENFTEDDKDLGNIVITIA